MMVSDVSSALFIYTDNSTLTSNKTVNNSHQVLNMFSRVE